MARPRKAQPTAAPTPAQPAPAPIQLTAHFDLDQLSVADLPLLHKMRRGEALDVEVVELFDRIVDGGAKAIPYPALSATCRALYKVVFNLGDPETPQGN